MNKLILMGLVLLIAAAPACQERKAGVPSGAPEAGKENAMSEENSIAVYPVEHASLVIKTSRALIYVDPVGERSRYKGFGKPDIILITHAHHDHLQPELVTGFKTGKTAVIGNADAISSLGYGDAMQNGESKTVGDITIEAIAMYNMTKERLRFHPKGVGNGYVINADGKRIYISGDTEDIPEMRALKNIDYAFLCMNLPYTMTVEQAADAVLAFKPETVYPYHFRGENGMSDLNTFKKLVSADPAIKVEILKWY